MLVGAGSACGAASAGADANTGANAGAGAGVGAGDGAVSASACCCTPAWALGGRATRARTPLTEGAYPRPPRAVDPASLAELSLARLSLARHAPVGLSLARLSGERSAFEEHFGEYPPAPLGSSGFEECLSFLWLHIFTVLQFWMSACLPVCTVRKSRLARRALELKLVTLSLRIARYKSAP